MMTSASGKTTEAIDYLSQLDEEILCNLAQYLNPVDLRILPLVSKKFSIFVDSWKKKVNPEEIRIFNPPQRNTVRGCFWKIEHDGNQGYLLGSMHEYSDHLLDPEGKIMKCFKESKCLALESDLTKILSHLNHEEIDILFNQFNQNEKRLFEQNTLAFITAIGCEKSIHLKENILLIINDIFLKIVGKHGMESKLANLAKKRCLDIYELEDHKDNEIQKAFQSTFQSLFGQIVQIFKIDFPYSNILLLLQKLDEKLSEKNPEIAAAYEKYGFLENWKTGDLEYFEIYNRRGVPPGSGGKADYGSLYIEQKQRSLRNEVMAEKLLVLIKEGKLPFAAVGVRHTVNSGEFPKRPIEVNSVFEYLLYAGCKITRVSDSGDEDPMP